MARPKNQKTRRAQLIQAGKKAIALHGLNGLRIKDIAEQCELTAGAVAYYYPAIEDLLRAVHQHELDRFYWARLRETELADDPRYKLCHAVKSGIPRSSGDIDYQVLNEMHVQAFRDSFHARLMSNMFDREVSLYLPILETGESQGWFSLRASSLKTARNLVALEDAYGLHILGGSPIDVDEAYALILAHAEAATDCTLMDLPE